MKQRVIATVTNDLNYDQRMQRHAKVLSEAGYQVLLVGRILPNSVALKAQPFEQYRIRCFFNKGKLFYLEYNIRLLFFLLKSKADIHVAVDLDTLLPNQMASSLLGRKLVFDAHEYFTEVPELQGRSLSRGIWDWVAKACIDSAHLAYTVGPSLAFLFSDLYKKKFSCIMNVPPLQAENNKSVDSSKSPVIFYQGALNEGRGLEPLIAAMQQVDAHLQIAGEGDLSEKLRAITKQLQVEDRVTFLGWVSPAALPELTRNATIGINLLEPKGLSYQYSLANKYFDYMHAGVPQLCAEFTEYQKLNEENEIACLCKCTREDILEGLSKLLTNKNYYERLQLNCRKAAQSYNLQVESEKLLALYQTL